MANLIQSILLAVADRRLWVNVGKALVIGIRIVGVCVGFVVCSIVGGIGSGLSKAGGQTPAGANFLSIFLALSVCVGVVVSALILRSRWRGWTLAGAIFVGVFGIATVAPQVETVFFLWNKLSHETIRAIFLQGAISAALFAPLAVLILGKWPASVSRASVVGGLKFKTVAILVVAFVFLYMFFGYYVAWQNPAVRQYYGGLEQPSFLSALQANWVNNPWVYALQVGRALLYTGCLYPLVRMLRGNRGEAAVLMALFLSIWTGTLLLPNPLMPVEVANTHFRETLGFSLVFGALAGWMLAATDSSA